MTQGICLHLATAACFGLASISAIAQAIDFKAEAKFNYRDSGDEKFFAANFPAGSGHKTVEAGDHFEISNIAFMWDWQLSEKVLFKAKIDAIDLYEKNPTSDDHDISLDRLILRYGNKYTNNELPRQTDFYAQIGKFGKFERQEDRHLESYGVVSTAFNRVEDSGIEFGVDLPSGLYGKLSYTTGNPVFFRDPNALAGDNGNDLEAQRLPGFDPEYESGVLVLYDAEVEDFDLSEAPELGAAVGYRWLNETGSTRVNFMLFGYTRELADTRELHGTEYGGDLDFFEFSELGLPPEVTATADYSLEDDQKDEAGANVWIYHDNFSLFAQYVYQDVGGLERDGLELELSYAYETENLAWLDALVPVMRVSKLDNDFVSPVNNPTPSIAWDWRKMDLGFNMRFNKHHNLAVEYAFNRFLIAGEEEENDELLLTYTWRYD